MKVRFVVFYLIRCKNKFYPIRCKNKSHDELKDFLLVWNPILDMWSSTLLIQVKKLELELICEIFLLSISYCGAQTTCIIYMQCL